MLHGGMHALNAVHAVQIFVLFRLFLAYGPCYGRLTTSFVALLVPPFKFGISDDPCT